MKYAVLSHLERKLLYYYWLTRYFIEMPKPEISVMLVLPELVEILVFKMAENNSIRYFYWQTKMVFRWTCYCSFGHAGDVITSAEWELPTGFSATISWLSLSCSQGICTAQAWWPSCTSSIAQHQLTPTQVNCEGEHLTPWCTTGFWLGSLQEVTPQKIVARIAQMVLINLSLTCI